MKSILARGAATLIAGAIVGCAAPMEAPPPPAPLAPTAPAVGSLASLAGRWVNPDQRQDTLVLAMTIAPDGRVDVDRPHDPRRAIAFEAFRDGAIVLRARYFSRSDVCVPAGEVPVQRLNCTFSATTARPREGSYVLTRASAR